MTPTLIEKKTNEIINFSLKLLGNVSKMNNRSLVEVKPILEEIENTVTSAYETEKGQFLQKSKEICDKEREHKENIERMRLQEQA